MQALEIHPATAQRWSDLEALFGPSGAYSGCWCMYLRESAREFDANVGAENRRAFRAVVAEGRQPGLLAYRDGLPVGWVAVAPRAEYPRVLRSPLHKPADELDGVWAITCFYIARSERNRGVATTLLDAAVDYCIESGATAIEAYPSKDGGSAADLWRGTRAMFDAAGFETLVERRPGRPVLRRTVRAR